MISFIMMAKNVESYIGKAIDELLKENEVPWELVIIEDHSDDKTFEIADSYAKRDQRITLQKNPYRGKVLGTNYGYSLTKGDIIKCIDSDDILVKEFFSYYDEMKKYDAHCHSAWITDEILNKKAVYNTNPLLFNKDYDFVLSNLLSLPKWTWSFSRSVADKIFPLPEKLPFEDVWISLTVKKYSKTILNINKPLYLYRQHSNQTFGGIINYNKDRVIFRAKRLLKLMNVLETEKKVFEGYKKTTFNKMREYNLLLSQDDLSLLKILKAELNFMAKTKVVLIRKLPSVSTYITILKWKIDAFQTQSK